MLAGGGSFKGLGFRVGLGFWASFRASGFMVQARGL